MSEVQKLESLLTLIQRNRQKPRAVAEAPQTAATPAARTSKPSPLEVAIGGATEPPAPAAPTPVAAKPAPRRPVPAKPTAPKPPPRPAPVARQAPVAKPTPAAASKPVAATPVAAASVADPSGPVAVANEAAVAVEPKTFGELLGQSLSLQPR